MRRIFQWMLAGVAMAGQLCLFSAMGVSSEMQCAARYHGELQGLAAQRSEGLGRIFKDLRSGDAALPGRWMFNFDPKDEARGKVRTAPRLEKACVAEVRFKGRKRCDAFEDRVVPSNEIAFAYPSDAVDARAVKLLQDFVTSRGAVPDVGDNGRHTWVMQRLPQDLRLYISQPAHPGLCAGGGEVSEFYDQQLKPLSKRRAEVVALAEAARSRAAAMARQLAAAIAAEVAGAAADKPTPHGASYSPAHAVQVETSTPQSGLDSARPADLVVSLVDIVRPALLPERLEDLKSETSAVAALRRARFFLLDWQNDAARDERAHLRPSKAVQERMGKALMALEVQAYAELLNQRYQSVQTLLLTTPGEIAKAHSASCTCD